MYKPTAADTGDLTAARSHGIIDALTQRAIACYADKGYLGAGSAIGTPYHRHKHRKFGRRKKLFNRHHAKTRSVGEQGAAALKRRHILRHTRCSPARLTTIVQAILTLHHHASRGWKQFHGHHPSPPGRSGHARHRVGRASQRRVPHRNRHRQRVRVRARPPPDRGLHARGDRFAPAISNLSVWEPPRVIRAYIHGELNEVAGEATITSQTPAEFITAFPVDLVRKTPLDPERDEPAPPALTDQ
ncbi:transposase family protein [Actinomadura rugatobispora]|uniref:Transposase family protein n=1 Tax=Actinomadura rugatobispora TaxID=1994 RepID=A0ABW0ZRR8_9ACTN|nr:hypothetical protein GCM10010200_035530 [Actinomadura rugatobispora]